MVYAYLLVEMSLTTAHITPFPLCIMCSRGLTIFQNFFKLKASIYGLMSLERAQLTAEPLAKCMNHAHWICLHTEALYRSSLRRRTLKLSCI